MKATFALLANLEAYNLVRQLSWEVHLKYQTGTIDNRLPPHVSLKQPFSISGLDELERYMQDLARSITPIEITLTELQLEPILHEGIEYGVLWIDVFESEELRQLHTRVNQELKERFKNTQAAYDGSDYHFHMTICIGGQKLATYKEILKELKDRNIALSFTAKHLAMFVYEEPLGPHGEYLTYKILPLGG